MKRTSQDYVRYVAPIAGAALSMGGFIEGPRGHWLHGRRRFSPSTINKLIADGLARRTGNRVVKR